MVPWPRVLAGGLWFAGLVLFAATAVLAAEHDRFPGDLWMAERLQGANGWLFSGALDWTEDLAQMPLAGVVALLAALVFLFVAGPGPGALMLSTVLLRFNPLLKEVIDRPRPSPELVRVEGDPANLSFPSGHAFNCALIYGLMFYLATVYIPFRWPRLAVQIGSAWVILVTGLERVYVGHHWPSDVIGGFLIGGLTMALLVTIDVTAFRNGGRVSGRPGRSLLSSG